MKTIIEYLNEYAKDYIEARDGEHFEEMCRMPSLYMAASGVAEKAGKEFARQVAQKALEDASERAEVEQEDVHRVVNGHTFFNTVIQVNKSTILTTPIVID